MKKLVLGGDYIDKFDISSDMSSEFYYIFSSEAVELFDSSFLLKRRFSLISIQEPFLIP